MGGLRLYGRYIAVSLSGQMQYPIPFLMGSAAQFGSTIIEFVGVWALFHRFGGLDGWTLGEVALFYAVVSAAFAITDMITRGFDVFGEEFVRTGAFDRILLRPRSAALQLMGYEFRASRIGRLAQAVFVFAVAAGLLGLDWNAGQIATLAFALAGAAALFFAIMVLQATLAFWTVESLEIVNTLTYGGVDAAQYPLDIYARWFRNFLTFIVPLACVVYFPVCSILGRPERTGAPEWLLPIAPAFGFAFLAASFLVWRFGVRRYTSTGS